MELLYSLRYQKYNFSNKPILDKEGEIIVYSKGFRLKGKGAGDKGELINFSEIKEFYFRNEKIYFITFTKEKYVLTVDSSQFDQLLTDLYKSRNDFLLEALFMKQGKLIAEFDCHFERVSKFGKPINKGEAKMKIFGRSIIVIPKHQDAFSISFHFLSLFEFNEIEYKMKIISDAGVTTYFSRFGNEFERLEETFNNTMGQMYSDFVNNVLKKAFPEFHAGDLLKMAYKMNGGKAVSLKEVKKISEELAERVEDFIFASEEVKEKMSFVTELVDDYNFMLGISQDVAVSDSFIRWAMFAIPEKNVVAFTIFPRWTDAGSEENEADLKTETFFFKIIMEKGNPADKMEDKVLEIEQALINLDFIKDPCYKDKRELKHSPYQYAIRKMPFLRILRKSYVGMASSPEKEKWDNEVKEVFETAKLKKGKS